YQLTSTAHTHTLPLHDALPILIRKPPPFTSISKQETIDELIHLHEQAGFRPELRRAKNGQELVLKHCPFQQVATTYQSVICPIQDRKSARLNSSHGSTSYAVFC